MAAGTDTVSAAAAASTAYALVPTWLQEASNLIRDIATVAGAVVIPIVIWRAGRRRENQEQLRTEARDKRRATLELLRILVADPTLVERASRIFRFRRFKQGIEGFRNPYLWGEHTFTHDCLVTLNILDAACIEILTGRVEEEFLFETSRDLMIGALAVFELFSKEIGEDRSDNYPHFLTIAKRWDAKVTEKKLPVGMAVQTSKPVAS